MTNNDIAAGEAALKAYVQQVEGWEAAFVPEQAIRDGAIDVIKTWDSVGPATNPDADDLKHASCGLALYQAIVTAGYGSYVTPEQCTTGADAVIAAVLAGRPKTPAQGS